MNNTVFYPFSKCYHQYLLNNGFEYSPKTFEGEITYFYTIYKKNNIEITLSEGFNFGRAGNSVVFYCVADGVRFFLQIEVDGKSLNLLDYYPDRLKKILEEK